MCHLIDWDCTNKLNSLLFSIKFISLWTYSGGPPQQSQIQNRFFKVTLFIILLAVLTQRYYLEILRQKLKINPFFISNPIFVNLTPNTECTMSSSKGHTAVWKTFIPTQKISRQSLSGFHFPKVQLWVKCANISPDILLNQIKMWISGLWGRRKPFDYRAAEPKMSCLTVLCVYIWQATRRAQLFSSSAVYLSPLTVSTEFFSQ